MNIIEFVISQTGLTRAELARMIGRKVVTLYRWEHKGISPKQSDIEKLSKVLHMRPSQLLDAIGK